MPILETLGCKCGQCLSNEAFGLLKPHFGYLLDYKKNLKNLEDEKTNLGRQLVKIKGKVEEANTRGEDILDEVSEWLNNAELKEQELDQFMDNKAIKENMLCFKRLSCPNFMWRYRLSKQAEEKIEDVKKLTLEAANYENVSRPKPAPPQLRFRSDSALFMSFDSREWVFESIVEALVDSDVKMVGVYGPGGVGKTTMVEAVGRQVREDGLFDEVLMAVASLDATVFKIQGLLSDRLNLKLEAETEVGRAGQLWNRLNNGKKNLIILDDIWEPVNLKAIGIPITDGNKGCKLVLTSRNRDTWKNIQVHHKDFPIDILSEKEAWALFEKKLGNSVGSVGELSFVAKAVCRECQGLPVAINAVGAALKDRELHAWKDALKKLEKSMLNNIEGIDPNLYTSLKLSYDLLQSKDAKSIFLLCCLFPEDADISIEDDLMRHCMATRLLDQNPDTLDEGRAAVLTVVGTLKTSCLLLEGCNGNYVKIHDVIRDVALSIWKLELGKTVLVKEGIQEWPDKSACEGYSAIVLRDVCFNELPDELVCPQLHTLRLWQQYDKRFLKVPDNFFSAMENLTILDLQRICLSSSLAKLVNLRMLSLFGCKLEDTSILKDLKKSLEMLIIGLNDDDDMTTLLLEVGQLTRLRLLDLRYCYNLKAIPQGVISNLTHLEELYIPDTCGQWEGTTADVERNNASLVEVGSLTRLTSLEIHLTTVATLPKDFCFEKLIRFQISVGKKFNSDEIFQFNERSFKFTRILKLSGITLEDDQFSVLCHSAECLYLEKLQGLKKLIHNRGGELFLNVKYLAVKNCDDLEYLFSSSCAQLQHLEIKDCQMIEKIVGIFEGEKDEEELTNKVVNFSQLKYMMLEKLPNLISFYPRMKKIATPEGNSSSHSQPLFNEKVAFPALEKLMIGDVPNINKIWDEQLSTSPEIAAASCPKLTVIEVYKCVKFMHVVSSAMLSLLQKMRELHVRDCGMMEMIILEKAREKEPILDNIIVLHQLRALSLCNLPNLKSFCSNITTTEGPLAIFNHQVAFPALKELNIEDVPNFKNIWDEQLLPVPENETAFFPILTVVKVYKCEKLMHVVSSNMLPVLQEISELRVRDCEMMEVIVSEKAIKKEPFVFLQLTALSLDNLPNLKSFGNSITISEAPLAMFNYQFAFPVLKELAISNVPNITRIWDQKFLSTESFCQLKDVSVGNCYKLENLFMYSMLSRLQNLEVVTIKDCLEMEVIISKKREEEATNDDNILFPQLKILNFEHLNNFKGICDSIFEAQTFNHKVAFPKLTGLFVINCGNFGEIRLLPLMLQRLQNLRRLTVKNCDWLKEVDVVGEGQHVGLLTNNKIEVILLDNLPQLTSLWNKDPHTGIILGNLKYLVIGNCPLLRNLFTSSVAMALERLKGLVLISCMMMEEVIVATNQGEDKAQVIDEIVFPNLVMMVLIDMPALEGFCTTNSNLNLQSLQCMLIRRCPKMKTFTLGQIYMRPQISLYTSLPNFDASDVDEGIQIEDLNSYLQQRFLEGEDNNDKDKEDYNDFINKLIHLIESILQQ